MVRLANARRPRESMTLTAYLDEFAPNKTAAEAWLVARRWPDGVRCAHCESALIGERKNRRPQLYWCHDCRRYFSLKTHTLFFACLAVELSDLGRCGVFDAHEPERGGQRQAGG